MANKLELLRQFKSLGISVQEDILNCAVDMCGRLFIDERELVETWLAFSLTNLNGAKPTVEYLLQMEQKEFSDKSLNTPKKMSGDLPVYDFQTCLKRKKDTQNSASDDEIPTLPSKVPCLESSSQAVQSPVPKKGIGNNQAAGTLESSSQAVQSPVPNTPSSYSKRANAGRVQNDFGQSLCNWESKDMDINVKIYKSNPEWKAMHSSLLEESKILSDCAKDIIDVIVEKNKLDLSENKNDVDGEAVPDNNDEVVFPGRILGLDSGKLNLSSVMLDNLDGASLDVDMSGLSSYSIFPGQVVVCTGPKRGKKIIAHKIMAQASLPMPEYESTKPDPIQIIVAAGPFSQNDDLTYEPLQDLIKHVKTQKPHVFILIGPLVDSNHTTIKNGNMNETFSQFLNKILDEIKEALEGCRTKFFIVASSFDSFSKPIYPTQPPTVCDSKYKDSLLPDPCLLNVDGFLLGLTGTDILMHLSKNEISNEGDRLTRLASHLIWQQSFYPLYPSIDDVGLDLNLWMNHGRLPVTPHAMIMPSDLHCFIKEAEGVVAINPGKLSKGLNGGNFACIEVQPPIDGKWSPGSNVAAKLVKI